MKTIIFKSAAVLLISFGLIQSTQAEDRDDFKRFDRDGDRRIEYRDNDRRFEHRDGDDRYFERRDEHAFRYERRRNEREFIPGHYITDRCGRLVWVPGHYC